MSGRCEGCRWWTRTETGDLPERYRDWGECDLAAVGGTGGLRHNKPKHAETLAVADGSEWQSLLTAPEYGCVQWAARERDA